MVTWKKKKEEHIKWTIDIEKKKRKKEKSEKPNWGYDPEKNDQWPYTAVPTTTIVIAWIWLSNEKIKQQWNEKVIGSGWLIFEQVISDSSFIFIEWWGFENAKCKWLRNALRNMEECPFR